MERTSKSAPVAAVGARSTGSLRLEDLLPAVMDVIEELGGNVPDGIDDNPPPGYYETEEATFDYEDLLGAANDLCPPYLYYGGNIGDPACVGIWIDHESLRDGILNEPPEIVRVTDGLPSADDMKQLYRELTWYPYVLLEDTQHDGLYEYTPELDVFWRLWFL